MVVAETHRRCAPATRTNLGTNRSCGAVSAPIVSISPKFSLLIEASLQLLQQFGGFD